jgi:hypothetical protein
MHVCVAGLQVGLSGWAAQVSGVLAVAAQHSWHTSGVSVQVCRPKPQTHWFMALQTRLPTPPGRQLAVVQH